MNEHYTVSDLAEAARWVTRRTEDLIEADNKVISLSASLTHAQEAFNGARLACREAAIKEEKIRAWLNQYASKHLRGSL